MYGSTTKSGVVKRSDCILVYGSTTKGDVVENHYCRYVHTFHDELTTEEPPNNQSHSKLIKVQNVKNPL